MSTKLTTRRVGVAGLIALVGCAVACSIPMLAALGFGGGLMITLANIFAPGTELVVGVGVFALALGFMLLRQRPEKSCGSSCQADASCCGGKFNGEQTT